MKSLRSRSKYLDDELLNSITKSCYIQPKLNCSYTFPINLELNGIPFGTKSTGKL